MTEKEELILRAKAYRLAATIQELIFSTLAPVGEVRKEQARESFADAIVECEKL